MTRRRYISESTAFSASTASCLWDESMVTCGSVNQSYRPNIVYKTFVDDLHDGDWFIAQGRKYADEANAMVARWGRFLLIVTVVACAIERFL